MNTRLHPAVLLRFDLIRFSRISHYNPSLNLLNGA